MAKKQHPIRKYPIEFDIAIFPKNIRWLIDMDYLRKLPKKDQIWMAKFIKEYYNANVKKGDRKAFHKNQKLRRDCYQRKNAQNRDLMSILNSNGKIDRIPEDNEDSNQARLAFTHLDSKQRSRS